MKINTRNAVMHTMTLQISVEIKILYPERYTIYLSYMCLITYYSRY